MAKLDRVMAFLEWARSTPEEEVAQTLKVCLKPSPDALRVIRLRKEVARLKERLEDVKWSLQHERRRCRKCGRLPGPVKDVRAGWFRVRCSRCKGTIRMVRSLVGKRRGR